MLTLGSGLARLVESGTML